MSTANFKRMEHFPLYAHEDIREGYCPRCDCWHELDGDDDMCPECGASLQGISVNDYANAEFVDEVTQRLDDLAADLTFWRVSVCSGYYGGVQLYAESVHDDPEDLRLLPDALAACYYYLDVVERLFPNDHELYAEMCRDFIRLAQTVELPRLRTLPTWEARLARSLALPSRPYGTAYMPELTFEQRFINATLK